MAYTNGKIIQSFLLPYRTNYRKATEDVEAIQKEIEYPYMRYYTPLEEIQRRFLLLRAFRPVVVMDQPYRLTTMTLRPHDLQYKGRYMMIVDQPSEYPDIESMSDYFNEHCRVHCRFFTAPGSTYEYFKNHLGDIIQYLKIHKKPITVETLREAVWTNGYHECSTFKPKLERFFIDLFGAKRILDVSSGWGDRLIGAMASDIELYHGFDPNPCLHPGYNEIIQTFRPLVVNPKASFVIQPIPFERADLKDEFYDLVMTSPPYFNMEIYEATPADTPSQQSVRHRDTSLSQEKHWYSTYLLVWMKKCLRALKQGGILAININQYKDQHYVYWLLEDMKDMAHFLGTIAHAKPNKKNPQPTFLWKRDKDTKAYKE